MKGIKIYKNGELIFNTINTYSECNFSNKHLENISVFPANDKNEKIETALK